MLTTTPSARKRKRSPSEDKGPDSLSIELSSLSDAQVGPVLGVCVLIFKSVPIFDYLPFPPNDTASFPFITPPKNTAFDIFVKEEDEGKEFVKRSSTIAGGTDTVELSGSANDGSDGAGSRYFLALHRPGSSKLILQPAPVYLISRQVKVLKNFKPTELGSSEHLQARSMLGKAFGTKKAKAAIQAHERNKVDVHAIGDVAGVLQDRIDEGTGNLLSQEQMEDSANATRLIPAYNADAQRPEDIYPLHNIVPEPEWAALDSILSKLKNATDDRARTRLLPNARSDWLRQHLILAYSSPKPKPKVAKMLIYASMMFTFRSVVEKFVPERTTLLERLAPAPEVVVDGLLARFTETPRYSTRARMTSDNETTLLTHLFSLYTTLIAADLRISPTRVNGLFRSLGCTIAKLSPRDLMDLGLPDSAGLEKRAILKVPLVFPKPKLKRRA
ncbi:Rpa49 subunit specific to nuclear RNA polymerase I [Russula compacta]|nr:Rpa49 subunit specific to nuclear RNA polymerase I [Russula compacta]